jgi:hypothetical protein
MSTFTGTPNQLPRPQQRAVIRFFKSIDSFFEFFDGIDITDKRINGGSGTYKGIFDTTMSYTESSMRSNDVSWLGEPCPSSVEEALSRRRYQNMPDFNDVYRNSIARRIQDILRNSSADLEVPVLKYNDLGLGTFDFNKASTGLIALYKYYSFERQEYVEGQLVDTYKDGEKYKYRLITDGSPVALVPSVRDEDDKKLIEKAYKEIYNGANPFEALKKYGLKVGGANAFSSTIKKSYVLKEKFPKTKNAVRIFFKVGENSNVRWPSYKWVGYAAIGIAELLDTLGYATSIIGVNGNQTRINIEGSLEAGTRFWGITLKRFEETLDKDSLLYIASDPSFFRVKIFECIIKRALYHDDYLNTGLGRTSYKDELEQMIFNEYGKRDKLFFDSGKRNENSQFLYYILTDIYSEEDMNTAILEIALDVVNKNKEARERIYGIMQEQKVS